MPKALALYSGGLDSILSILAVMKQGIDVAAIRFLTSFNTRIRRREQNTYAKLLLPAGFDFIIKDYPIYEKFLNMLKSPKYGYGKNMNPCVDCKILMLKEAKRIMLEEGYDFIITGEVLWQRPMSQRRDILSVIDREASVKGYVVRPLSAKLFNPSLAELAGLIDRQGLYDFSGRTRKPQMRLAQEMGLSNYAQPAGGCLLTDPLYSAKLSDLMRHNPDPSISEINLLQLGRHYRISADTKIIAGRDNMDNELIQAISEPLDCLLWVEGYGSSLTIIKGKVSDETIKVAAALCARHSNAKNLPEVKVSFKISGNISTITVNPASDSLLNSLRV